MEELSGDVYPSGGNNRNLKLLVKQRQKLPVLRMTEEGHISLRKIKVVISRTLKGREKIPSHHVEKLV